MDGSIKIPLPGNMVHTPHHNKSLEFYNKTIHTKEKLVFPIELIKCYGLHPTLGLAI